jgi:hypothetical protein
MLADLQVYDRDPVDEPASSRPALLPSAVFVGGVRVFGNV